MPDHQLLSPIAGPVNADCWAWHITSTLRSRLGTGVQTVREPICQYDQLADEPTTVPAAASCRAALAAAEYSSLPFAPYCEVLRFGTQKCSRPPVIDQPLVRSAVPTPVTTESQAGPYEVLPPWTVVCAWPSPAPT